MGVEYVVDTGELKRVTTWIRRVSLEISTELRRDMRAAGQIVADEAMSNAPSEAVAATIKVRTTAGGAVVKVVAGIGEREGHVGEAAAYENKGSGGTFRHPVFGNHNVWVDQTARPYMTPALATKQEEVLAAGPPPRHAEDRRHRRQRRNRAQPYRRQLQLGLQPDGHPERRLLDPADRSEKGC